MTFRRGQLHYFVVVAEEGQMTRAAKRLSLAQPALSQAIAQLESEVGVPLLERHARGVSLTQAGEIFYEKAKRADEAAEDAARTARTLARGREGTIVFGFLGAPPSVEGRVEIDTFSRAHPDIELRYRELPFPPSDTSAWLAEVDVAVAHMPPADEAVWSVVVRREPRVALVPDGHRLARSAQLRVEQLLDETFISFADSVDPGWAGFWSLDDHRGGPPRRLTGDRAANPQEVIAALRGDAITVVPLAAANVLAHVFDAARAIALQDAAPSRIALVGHREQRNPLVTALRAFAGQGAAGQPQGDGSGRQGGAGPL